MWTDVCWLPYGEAGHLSQCHLPRGHRGTCEKANQVHLEFVFKANEWVATQFARWNAEGGDA